MRAMLERPQQYQWHERGAISRERYCFFFANGLSPRLNSQLGDTSRERLICIDASSAQAEPHESNSKSDSAADDNQRVCVFHCTTFG